MIRKLVVLAAMAGVFALLASPSLAQEIHVENPGHHEVETEVNFGIFAHVAESVEVPALQCDSDWEVDVTEEGHVDLWATDLIPHAGQVGACDTIHACRDGSGQTLPWEGQIFEDFHNPYSGPHQEGSDHEFGIDLTFCLDATGGALDNVPVPVTCEINDDEGHCDWFIGIVNGVPLEAQGELLFHEPLGLMHMR